MSDETLKTLLKGSLLLDGSAALNLCERGFAAELGVEARPWSLKTVSFEKTDDSKIIPVSAAVIPSELHPLDETVKILSDLYHRPSGISPEMERLAPGSTFYGNRNGGRIAIVAIPVIPYSHNSFGMLDETRKEQLLRLLDMLGGLPFFYRGTEEIVLKSGSTTEGDILMIINTGLDDIPDIHLGHHCNAVSKVMSLQPDGDWKPVPFKYTQNQLSISQELRPQLPAIFRIEGTNRD